ncbi:hypothetical protein GZ998_05540 [Actinomyces sp. 594]|uniref:hypothetical protein n=1 Tax=Actinomyces sp. 594 TaxID=2057793 RepID=UPI001C5765CA|nr:hypothetical protein [Actinomyces sp. 594]MBW3068976.1 hypothetical protein [Actinomyces sp. 594]
MSLSNNDTSTAGLMALAAWTLRGLLNESHYDLHGDRYEGRDDGNPPLTIRRADGELLHLRQGPDGKPVIVDDQAGAVTPIDTGDIKGSMLCALHAADVRAVDRLYERLGEIADAHEHAARTGTGIVLFSKDGKRLCDWTPGTDGKTGDLCVFCRPLWGYMPKARGWKQSGPRSLDAWLDSLDAELDQPGTL